MNIKYNYIIDMFKTVGICFIIFLFLIYLFSDCSSCIERFNTCNCRQLKLKCNVNKHLQRKCFWTNI
uniref:Late nodulin n=1 Tax=viral metagenome TaxID=1070528 RepID=A0A6C0JI87_9ZZZZ